MKKTIKPTTGGQVFDMIMNLTDVDEMFDLVCAGNFFRGNLGGMMPVDESRMVFGRIKELLKKK